LAHQAAVKGPQDITMLVVVQILFLLISSLTAQPAGTDLNLLLDFTSEGPRYIVGGQVEGKSVDLPSCSNLFRN
jgi:hypothetical protein